MWVIDRKYFPYIILASFILFFIVGIALGFRPSHG